jgi:hypothetical protein
MYDDHTQLQLGSYIGLLAYPALVAFVAMVGGERMCGTGIDRSDNAP